MQPERTALAWRRTQLALVVAALLVSRIALDDLLIGPLGWLIPLVLATLAFVGTRTTPIAAATDGAGRLARMAVVVAMAAMVEAVAMVWSVAG